MWAKRTITALLAGAILLTASPAVGNDTEPAADPAVIAEWNAIAVATITGAAPNGAGKANPEAFLWYAFVHTAVYNAVVGITGEFEPLGWQPGTPRDASPEAAAAAAAHEVLSTYFGANPTIAANLDVALATSLARVPDGEAEDRGVRYGRQVAGRLIRMRADDGRNAPLTFDVPLAPGVWRPAPPGNAQFFAPWLGRVDPFVLKGLRQFRPGPPPAINSATYVEEFEEVRDFGVKTGSLRTPQQTETALFFSDQAIVPLQVGVRDLVTRQGLNISESARLFAAVEVSLADAVNAAWDAKYHYGSWRPITAIRLADQDGNPATAGIPDWESLVNTPAYPDWPSGTPAAIGALSTVLSRLSEDGSIDLNLTSGAAGVSRHYDDAAVIQQDVIDARVWAGIHFRTADEVGVDLGVKVANWALDHHFGAIK